MADLSGVLNDVVPRVGSDHNNVDKDINIVDEFEDVDWEEDDEEGEVSDSDDGKGNEEVRTIRITLPNETVVDKAGNSTATSSHTVKKKKRPQVNVKFFEEDFSVCQERRQQQLVQRIEDAVLYWEAANDSLVAAAMCSLLPAYLLAAASSAAERSREHLRELILWFTTAFKVLPHDSITEEEGRDGYDDAASLLNHTIRHAAGSSNQLNQAFFALLLGLNYKVRYVTTLDAVSFSPYEHIDIYAKRYRQEQQRLLLLESATKCTRTATSTASSTATTTAAAAVVTPNEIATKRINSSSRRSKQQPARINAWLEVLLVDQRSNPTASAVSTTTTTTTAALAVVTEVQWVQVDAAHKCIGHPEFVENVLRKGPPRRPIEYIISIESPTTSSTSPTSSSTAAAVGNSMGMVMKDVTQRYRFRFSRTLAKHQETQTFFDAWLQSILQGLSTSSNYCVSDDFINRSNSTSTSGGSGGNSSSGSSGSIVTQIIDLCGDDDDDDAALIEIINSSNNSGSSNSGSGSSSSSCSSSSSSSKRQKLQLVEHVETMPASQRHKLYPMPTRFEDFKQHPVYLLQRHLLSEEMLHPHNAAAVGEFRGESVYLQLHRETLRSKSQWRRIALRQVMPGAVAVRVVKRQAISRGDNSSSSSGGQQENNNHRSTNTATAASSGGGGDGKFESIELELFGSWQTVPIEIGAVKDGIIPVNEYGNVELWDENPAFLPAGAAFVAGQSALKAARSLQLPHAPAVVGFERRMQQQFAPRIGGAVVLLEHAQLLQEAAQCVEAGREQAAVEKKEKIIAARWEKLVHAAVTRQLLRDEYGH